MYELSFDYYQGPIEKLLELIEEKKLEVTVVSLSEVTAGFFDYLEKIEREGAGNGIIADFLSVASKLLLIKSKFILPSLVLSEEEEEDIKSLEVRLKIYQEFKQAKVYVKDAWSDRELMRTREFLRGAAQSFYPPKSCSPADFASAIQRVVGEIEKFMKPVVKVKNQVVSLKKKIEEVFSRLTKDPVNFKNLHGGNKKEVVVLFLAVLHLIRQQLVDVEQDGQFSDIIVAKL